MKKIILSGMLANGLEWYDFALYACMTTTISRLFFPDTDQNASILAAFGVFACGFLARPFGGVLFGWIGDKLGRRTALVLSIFMMAVPTGAIGLLPSYAQIGVAAPVLLIILRLLQGLSLGGAFCGAITFLVEHSPPERRGLVGSFTIASLVIGFLLGSAIVMAIQSGISAAAFDSWGWRIPFLLGLPIGLIGLYIREHCAESPTYETAKFEGRLSSTPVRDALTHEGKYMAQAVAIYITVTMPFYLVSAYFITFSESMLGRSKEEALLFNIVNMLTLFVVAPFSAWMSDRVGRKKIMTLGAAAFFLLSYPLFTLLLRADFTSVLLGQMAFAALVGLYTGPVPTVLVEIFPTRIRYTGMALSYNIAAAVFGGTSPYACQWLLKNTGNPYAIAFYIMACAAVSLVALYFYRDRHKEALA